MLEHLQWQHDRDMGVIDRLTGTLDRVVAAKFDRPHYAREVNTVSEPTFTADDLTDVLSTEDDGDFLKKVDKLVQ